MVEKSGSDHLTYEVATHTCQSASVSMWMLGMDLRAGNYATEIGVYETEFKFQVLIPCIKQESYLCMSSPSFILDFMAGG